MGKMNEELAYATIKEIDEKNSENLIEMINNEIGMDFEKKAQIDSKIKEIGKKIYKMKTIKLMKDHIHPYIRGSNQEISNFTPDYVNMFQRIQDRIQDRISRIQDRISDGMMDNNLESLYSASALQLPDLYRRPSIAIPLPTPLIRRPFTAGPVPPSLYRSPSTSGSVPPPLYRLPSVAAPLPSPLFRHSSTAAILPPPLYQRPIPPQFYRCPLTSAPLPPPLHRRPSTASLPPTSPTSAPPFAPQQPLYPA